MLALASRFRIASRPAARSAPASRKIATLLQRIGSADFRNRIAMVNDAHFEECPSPPGLPFQPERDAITYGELHGRSSALAELLMQQNETRPVGAFTKPSCDFVVTMLAAWKASRTFVPLSPTHSVNELRYFVEHSQLSTIVCPSTSSLPAQFEHGNTKILSLEDFPSLREALSTEPQPMPLLFAKPDAPALVLYTSGTTGRPKGVAHTCTNLAAQVRALTTAWEYSADDRILHFLPLYHMHGILNKLLCMLYSGGTVHFLPNASAPTIWKQLVREHGHQQQLDKFRHSHPTVNRLSLVMAVPTVYAKLLEHYPRLPAKDQARAVYVLKHMRLMVSGSAALPDTILHQWRDLTGHTLLERYGMTELGMALSNPYKGHRKVGSVGFPLQDVEVRLVDDKHHQVIEESDHPGELQVRGPAVFKEYIHNPQATSESFDGDWFRTGDIALRSSDGYYNILGRASADIIKSSGYKISALEIERELLSSPRIREAAVVAKPHPVTGEMIVAVILPADPELEEKEVRDFLNDRLVHYKQPKQYHFVKEIPRNHLGKVNKKTLLKDLQLD